MDDPAVLRFKLATKVEPGALARVLQLRQFLNLIPMRVMAQRIANRDRMTEVMEVEIEVPVSVMQNGDKSG